MSEEIMPLLAVIYTICAVIIAKGKSTWLISKIVWLSMVPVMWWAVFA